MKTGNVRFFALVCYLLATTAVAEAAKAQVADNQEDEVGRRSGSGSDEVAEIVVTAQKRSENLSDVPMSITALSGDSLLQRGVQSVQDLTKFTPGLSYVESGSSAPVYSLRGVGFFDTTIGARPAVSVYVDEVPLPFSIMAQGAAFDLERVEVLKGPQGTLFGQNSTGGAINYIASKPGRSFKAGVEASYSSFNTIDLQGFVSVPLGETLGVRVAGRLLRGDEWQRSYTRTDELGDRDLLQGRLIVDWRPADGAKLTLNINGFRDRSDTQAAQLIAFIPSSLRLAPQVPALATYPTAPQNNRDADWDAGIPLVKDNSFYQMSLRGDFDLSDAITLTSITAYSRFDVDQVTDQDGTSYNNVRTTGGGFNDSFSQEVRVSAELGPIRFMVGGNYAHDRAIELNRVDLAYSTTNFVTQPYGVLPATLQSYRQIFDTKALFGNVDWEISPTVRVHGGLRYTDVKLDYSGCTKTAEATGAAAITGLYNALRSARGLTPLATIPVGSCLMVDGGLNPGEATGTLSQDNISWRVGLDWKPSPRTLIYANVSRGYKAGSAPTINGLAIAQVVPAVQESVLAYEVGAKFSVLDGAADISAAAFYYDYTDKQVRGRTLVQPALLGPLETLVNIPRSKIRGAEAQINLRPMAGLNVTIAGTYLDSEVTSDFSNYNILGALQQFKGNSFPYTPKYQVILDSSYAWSVSESVDAFIGGNVNYRSATVAGFGSNTLLDIDSYALVDLRIGLESKNKRWRAQVFGKNIFDQYYWSNVAKFVDNVRRYSGSPATFGVSLSFRP
ncbi:TonB-dependent receptor [Novosphingobium sp. B1]|uniref:TonB-dependent receptor n=1 Tax=Novosphingobium sp. B1 TaxID=1938756 RepID=UPI0009D8D5AC|nr:TonB-dependent receptor [Novosphingobium sp. B1]SMC77863.1 Outer membrane receptor proteins, mostly Fe transport [Novosphingobium sp. B1]